MDWGGTNYSTEKSWSDRVEPGDFFSSGSKGAVPYEDMIALSNATGNDLWLTVPALADDGYLRSLAALVRDRLLLPADAAAFVRAAGHQPGLPD